LTVIAEIQNSWKLHNIPLH